MSKPETGLPKTEAATDGQGTPPKPQGLSAVEAGIAGAFGWVSGGLRRVVPGLVLVCVVALGFAVMTGKLTEWTQQMTKVVSVGRAALSQPELPGVLSIEPPQLYTRERLVNDRFRQANWLEEQLEKTKREQALSLVAREESRRSADFEMNDALGEEEPPSAASTQQGHAPEPLTASALQQLTAIDKVRLQLRTDLMDTLLDDGHDLQGNTLYRLNFDAVVMPLINRRNYPGTAVFIIEARDPYALGADTCDADMETCAAHRSSKERQRVLDDVELLRGWQREIQQFLTKVLAARIETFRQNGRLHNPVDPKENIALDWFLRRELITSFLGAIVYDPEVLALCRERGLVAQDLTHAALLAPGWSDACKNWISDTVGFAWRADQPVPTIQPTHALAPLIEAGFRKAIRRAHYINTVLAVEGQVVIQSLRARSAPPQGGGYPSTERPLISSAQGNSACPPVARLGAQGPCAPVQVAPPAAQTPVSVGSMPQDEDYKRALVRLITVWNAMEGYGHDVQFRMMMQTALAPSAAGSANAVKAAAQDAQTADAPAELRLLAALSKFDTQLPSEPDLQALRKSLRQEGAEGFVIVQGQPMPHPPLHSAAERCVMPTGAQTAAPGPQVYKCLMMRSEASQASHALLSRFLLARLQEELTPYDRESRSIRDFLDISLEGCGTTGCRIQVSQHRDLPGNEVFGAREAGFLPPVRSGALAPAGSAIPARFSDIVNAFKTRDRGFLGDSNWRTYLNANCLAKNLSLHSIRLTDEGLVAAKQIVDQNLAATDGQGGCDKRHLSFETRERLETTKSCLGLAERQADSHEARTEIYLSCMLRDWIDTQRSDVTVYAVSPRAGAGDDLTHQVEQERARIGAGLPTGMPIEGRLRVSDAHSAERILSNPSVIGFSHLPGSDTQSRLSGRSFTDRATFGWAIRPLRLSARGGYQSSHHRLSAVISLPSWWKRVAFDVRACWVQPKDVDQPSKDFTKLCRDDPVVSTDAETAAAAAQASSRQFRRHFEIKLPRRVEEITSRFNFDFIRAPYYYREFDQYVQRYPQILSLEAGRAGKLVLQGERLWRGTVVTVNNQSADSIVVLPDMKGVVAHFNCVYPPDGMFHFMSYEDNLKQAREQRSSGGQGGPPSQPPAATVPRAPLFVWTSEGGTTDKEVSIHPFVQRWKDETPCWLAKEN